MGQTRTYLPVKLIAAVTVSDRSRWETVSRELTARYSPIDMEMAWYPFHHTGYYREEMGDNLFKRMIAFTDLIDAGQLPAIKLDTNALEDDHAVDRRRCVNIDPGYICAPRLVLATTKDYAHRLYLGDDIFGDIHLMFREGGFQPQPWTYPDYQEAAVLSFFEQVRDRYLVQVGVRG